MGALAVLTAARGLTLTQLATQVGLDPELLAAADGRTRAVPISVVEQLAAALGLDVGTVERALGAVDLQRGNAAALRPGPRKLGLVGQPAPLARATSVAMTAAVRPPPPPRELLWVSVVNLDEENGYIKIFDVETGALVHTTPPLSDDPENVVLAFSFATDGRRVYAAAPPFAGEQGLVIAWDVETVERLWELSDPRLATPASIAYDPALEVLWVTDSALFSGGASGLAKVTTAGSLVHTVAPFTVRESFPPFFDGSFDGGTIVAVAVGDGCVWVTQTLGYESSALTLVKVDAQTMAAVGNAGVFGISYGLVVVTGKPRVVSVAVAVVDDEPAFGMAVVSVDPRTLEPDVEFLAMGQFLTGRSCTDGVGIYTGTSDTSGEDTVNSAARFEVDGSAQPTFSTVLGNTEGTPLSVALSARYMFTGTTSFGGEGGVPIARTTLAGEDLRESSEGFFELAPNEAPFAMLVVRRPDLFVAQVVARVVD